jgi:hypothetical protein
MPSDNAIKFPQPNEMPVAQALFVRKNLETGEL